MEVSCVSPTKALAVVLRVPFSLDPAATLDNPHKMAAPLVQFLDPSTTIPDEPPIVTGLRPRGNPRRGTNIRFPLRERRTQKLKNKQNLRELHPEEAETDWSSCPVEEEASSQDKPSDAGDDLV
ncbi:hypothetical protein MHYP_G00130510 [Metynnis hypsauchen]